mmetsp:Transcript_34467/g.84468  ORF Transcript_34467/g.84468 Transcript_34467/m.84468 type:complete len:244 (-) Transcript_34467:447-1178(-)
MDNFLDAQRENVFNEVAVMIYVFDVESQDNQRDLDYFRLCVESIAARSPDAKVFCLVHKMDLVPEEEKDQVFREKTSHIRSAGHAVELECFKTSIWDETLYKAWSTIVCSLVPNRKLLSSRLSDFCDFCGADEIVLFERATFLVIAHATLKQHDDVHRFEKISNIVKQFKLSCNKSRTNFHSLQLQSANLTALVDEFTQFTCVMLITSDSTVQPAASWCNVQNARDHFESVLEGQLGTWAIAP